MNEFEKEIVFVRMYIVCCDSVIYTKTVLDENLSSDVTSVLETESRD